jgi:hypothetical protein
VYSRDPTGLKTGGIVCRTRIERHSVAKLDGATKHVLGGRNGVFHNPPKSQASVISNIMKGQAILTNIQPSLEVTIHCTKEISNHKMAAAMAKMNNPEMGPMSLFRSPDMLALLAPSML